MEREKHSFEDYLPPLARLCAARELSEADIKKKLRDKKIPPQFHSEILNYLITENYIDNQRYALAFTHDKLAYNKWGRQKIKFHLRQQGIEEKLIDRAFDEISAEEYKATIENLIKSKLKTLKPTKDIDRKARLYRFLASKGFETELFMPIIEKFIEH